MLSQFKKIIPKPLIKLYHYLLAIAANFFYDSPSDKLIVIGVTGTSGKSTVVYLITKLLESAGYKVGCASTILFKVEKNEWLNDKKMTMVGRFALQKLIKRMVKANCQYAVIETTSQGIEQYRHLGINYDILVFTNLYPEHIQAHGSFANYKNAKLKLFAKLKNDSPKLFVGQKIKKTIIANLDDEHASEFLDQWAEEKYGFGIAQKMINDKLQIMNPGEAEDPRWNRDKFSAEGGLASGEKTQNSKLKTITADKIEIESDGASFQIDDTQFNLKLLGQHNVYHALAAITVCLSQGLSLEVLAKNLQNISGIPGRLEFIKESQPFKIIVDYAFEPKAVSALYKVVKQIFHQKIIHVLGSAGGGRDVSRRPALGQLAGQNADIVIVTNEDPYNEDPQKIIDQVGQGAISAGKTVGQNLFKILDRRQAIAKALSLAQPNDLVLITGKGSEQAIVGKNNKKIPWDDRIVAREELGKILSIKP